MTSTDLLRRVQSTEALNVLCVFNPAFAADEMDDPNWLPAGQSIWKLQTHAIVASVARSGMQTAAPPAPRRSVFLAYNRVDFDEVKLLRDDLRMNGLRVFWDQQMPAGNWRTTADKEIFAACAFVPCFSSRSLGDDSWMGWEIEVAIEARSRVMHREFILPVRLSDCELPQISLGRGSKEFVREYLADLNTYSLFGAARDRELTKLVHELEMRSLAHRAAGQG